MRLTAVSTFQPANDLKNKKLFESFKGRCQKKRENVGILKKKTGGGGVLLKSHFHFSLFLDALASLRPIVEIK
jgi:hypothetical protein